MIKYSLYLSGTIAVGKDVIEKYKKSDIINIFNDIIEKYSLDGYTMFSGLGYFSYMENSYKIEIISEIDEDIIKNICRELKERLEQQCILYTVESLKSILV